MINLKTLAPISKAERQQLLRDAADPKAAATRKGTTMDRFEEAREKSIAKRHFELGCWLFRFTKLRDLSPERHLAERVEIVTRIFLAGINNPSYDFFTVFDFGERQFDSIFEEGDSKDVIAGLRRNLPLDSTGMIASAFGYFGWPITAADDESATTGPALA